MRWVLPLGIAIVAIVSACGDDSSSPTSTPSAPASSAPSATVSPTLSASPSPTPNLNLFRRGPDIDFPKDIAMLDEKGCWGCDGGPGPLVRVYRDPSGAIRTEELFTDLASRYPPRTYDNGSGNGPQEYPATVTSYDATPDGSVIAAALCLQGACETGGLFGWDPNSVAAIVRSYDGGVTWQEIGRGGPVYEVSAVLANGQAIVVNATEQAGKETYYLLPDGGELQPPPGGVSPITVSNQILWNTNDGRLLFSDGSVFFAPPEADLNRYFQSVRGSISDGLEKGSVLVYWNLPTPLPRPNGYVDRFAIAELNVADGHVTLSRRWEIGGYLWTIGSWSPKDDQAIISIQALGSEYVTPFPAVLDLKTGVYNLIPGPFASDHPGVSSLGRTAVHAVQTGPFARVTGTGSCLNIRTDPSLTGEVVTCASDSVLLRDTGHTSSDWVSVTTPAGMQGWASAAFLER